MREPVEIYKEALGVYQRDPASWSVLYGILILLMLFTGGLAVVLLPNALRATRNALADERSPDVAELFRINQKDILEDSIAGVGLLVATLIASSFTGPLATFIGIVLGMAPPAVTEAEVGGIDALQLSVAYMQENPGPMVIHGLIASVLGAAALCCFFPVFVTAPIAFIAHWMFYLEHRRGILQLEG